MLHANESSEFRHSALTNLLPAEHTQLYLATNVMCYYQASYTASSLAHDPPEPVGEGEDAQSNS
jgi:hypothetical protein